MPPKSLRAVGFILFAIFPAVWAADPESDEGWQGLLKEIRRVASGQLAPSKDRALKEQRRLLEQMTASEAEIAGDGADQVCLPWGTHTETIPPENPRGPLERDCRRDPGEDPAAFAKQWQKFLGRVRSHAGTPDGPYTRYVLWRGHEDPESLDPTLHWGEYAYVLTKNIGGRETAVKTGVLMYRASYHPNRPKDLQGQMVHFQADGEGELFAVHKFIGIRLETGKQMNWHGPTATYNRKEDLEGWWTIRWHQVVDAWSAPTASQQVAPAAP